MVFKGQESWRSVESNLFSNFQISMVPNADGPEEQVENGDQDQGNRKNGKSNRLNCPQEFCFR